MSVRVGIVGTGEMGRPLVDRLVAAGHPVAAYARRAEVRADLMASGVEVVGGLAELAAGRDVVIVYVYSEEQVVQLAIDEGLVEAMDRGALLVIHTTGSPDTTRRLAERAADNGVGVVDAPGSGGPARVADGTLTLFVGGEDDDVDRCRGLFSAYASNIVHFGPAGSGQQVKLMNNLLFGAHVELAVHAARLCDGLGLDQAQVLATLHSCSGASAAIDMAAAMGSAEELVRSAGRFIHKDVLVARQLAARLGLDLDVLGPLTDRVLDRTATPDASSEEDR